MPIRYLRPNLAKAIREELALSILEGKIAPGQRLDEVELATRFCVSRTPIREVLQQLAMMGMIELRPRRGAIVLHLTSNRLYEMFEVQAELTAMAARLAVKRLAARDMRQLEQILEDMRQKLQLLPQTSGDLLDETHINPFVAFSESFHALIFTLSGNTFLAEQIQFLAVRLQPYRRFALGLRRRIEGAVAEHEAILQAFKNRDGEGAARAMRTHWRIQGEKFSDLVARLPRF